MSEELIVFLCENYTMQMKSILKNLFERQKYQQSIQLYKIIKSCNKIGIFEINFYSENFRYLFTNKMIEETSSFINENIFTSRVCIYYAIANGYIWHDVMKFIYSLKLKKSIKKDMINYMSILFNDKQIKMDDLYYIIVTNTRNIDNFEKARKCYEEYNRDCFNEFVKCIKREWSGNVLFDENVLEHEIKKYYGYIEYVNPHKRKIETLRNELLKKRRGIA